MKARVGFHGYRLSAHLETDWLQHTTPPLLKNRDGRVTIANSHPLSWFSSGGGFCPDHTTPRSLKMRDGGFLLPLLHFEQQRVFFRAHTCTRSQGLGFLRVQVWVSKKNPCGAPVCITPALAVLSEWFGVVKLRSN